MVGNWRKVFEEARARYPKSEFFAWVSDHDVWHARWLEMLVSVLESRVPSRRCLFGKPAHDARRCMAGKEGLRHNRNHEGL